MRAAIDAIRIEARIDLLRRRRLLNEQRRADAQHERESDLAGSRGARPTGASAGSDSLASPTFLECILRRAPTRPAALARCRTGDRSTVVIAST